MNTTMMMVEPVREFIELRLMEPWARNPRGGELRNMGEFTEQLRLEGVRDDVHLFRAGTGMLTIMQGHRRYAAAAALGLGGLWAKIWPFEEADAFRHLMTMQNGGDPFDARELALAAQEALKVGIPREELAGIFHRAEETVQLYLDLGTLPHRVQEAVYGRRMALGTAGLLRQLSKEQMEMALEGVLVNPLTGEGMSEAQARVYIENTFLKPLKQAKEWEVVSKKVRRALLLGGMDVGMVDVVRWEDRDQFVDSGALPQSAYMRCDEYIEDRLMVKPGEPMTWGELARSHGVPWHVVPAPVLEVRHLLLVRRSAVMDADDVAAAGTWVLKGKAWRESAVVRAAPASAHAHDSAPVGEEQGHEDQEGHTDEDEHERLEQEPEAVPFDEGRWRAVVARLMARKEVVMQDSLWKPLVGLVREMVAPLVLEEVSAAVAGTLAQDDSCNRQGLRHVMAWLLAASACGADEEALREVERVLAVGT